MLIFVRKRFIINDQVCSKAEMAIKCDLAYLIVRLPIFNTPSNLHDAYFTFSILHRHESIPKPRMYRVRVVFLAHPV